MGEQCEVCGSTGEDVRPRTYMSGRGNGKVLCDTCSRMQLSENVGAVSSLAKFDRDVVSKKIPKKRAKALRRRARQLGLPIPSEQ